MYPVRLQGKPWAHFARFSPLNPKKNPSHDCGAQSQEEECKMFPRSALSGLHQDVPYIRVILLLHNTINAVVINVTDRITTKDFSFCISETKIKTKRYFNQR
jgi:hypothetical protein